MDYDLTRLGDKQFEHLAQALLVKHLGPQVQVFGAGPDGGREASWDGPVVDARLPGGWDGYGVAQAKYMHKPGNAGQNYTWLRQQILHEFVEWTKPETRRGRLPQYYLIITNVTLSAVPGSGIDAIVNTIKEAAVSHGLHFKDVAIWHYDKIRTLLDDAQDIHKTYAAWTTPGDVLATLMQAQSESAQDLSDALRAHAAKILIDDKRLNLTQAGSVSDGEVGIADVFIDIPAFAPARNDSDTAVADFVGLDRPALPGIVAELLAVGDRCLDGSAVSSDPLVARASRSVLIGGPGQGKSTVAQYLCQMYRAAFLEGSPVLGEPQVRAVREAVLSHATDIGLEHPNARRWPIRIVLNDLADKLSEGVCTSVLDYITQQLSSRSGSSVTLSQVRAWLRDYPWFVVFDGLDEVPQTSNRGQVLTSISDFFIDARSVGADILAVATSRPQGYNDDFSREECRHYELAPLPPALALSYARRIIDVRTGAGSERARQVEQRLVRASKEEATSRLLTTPLQITILALLLERLGHAPRDRWRLFSQYYRVIYQREQEKGGDLAELLHTHESDVNAIHYKIGLLLQQRGERSGDTRGALSQAEFVDIIAERLESQGNEADDARSLANRFVTLAVDRLVFLAVLGGDEIGFEIRSLQEFMAAEAMLTGPDRAAVERLRSIATSAYWRNVFLFAVGRVFVADKEHLRSDITTMCADLNLDAPIHEATLPGSTLALDILRERVTSTQPAYTRVLANCACELLKLPPGIVRSLELDSLTRLGAKPQLMGAIEAAIRGATSRQLSAVAVLASLADAGDQNAFERLREAIGDRNSVIRSQILLEAYAYTSKSLTQLLVDDIAAEAPSKALSLHALLEVRDEVDEEAIALLPSNFKNLMDVAAHFYNDGGHDLYGADIGHDLVSLRINSLPEQGSNPWSPLAPISTEGAWALVRACFDFCSSPNASSLADALDVAAAFPSESFVLARVFPWPLAACLVEVSNGTPDLAGKDDLRASEEAKAARLNRLASLARQGELGDIDDWKAAERRWTTEPWSVSDLCFVPTWQDGDGVSIALPFSAAVRTNGCVLTVSGFGVGTPSTDQDVEAMGRWIRACLGGLRTMPPSEQRVNLASVLLFVCGIIDRWRRRGAYDQTLKQSVHAWLETPAGLASLSPAELFEVIRFAEGDVQSASEWLQSLTPQLVTEFAADIARLGNMKHLRLTNFNPFDDTCCDYFSIWRDDPSKWRLGRFRLHLPPDRTFSVPASFPEGDDVTANLRLFIEAVELSRHGDGASDVDWIRRNLPTLVKEWGTGGFAAKAYWRRGEDSLDLSRLVRWITYIPGPALGYSFASHLAMFLCHERSTLAEELVRALRSIVASRPSSIGDNQLQASAGG
ncbi:NACHT domain-containing protein [Micromonospora psammae]|uniref:NACHT domain-containing protein n=1 Tax=Micromonospora sp. CPCC 205556 TaxID=3122398 RepID=UPI002FF32062